MSPALSHVQADGRRPQLSSHGPESDALLGEVQSACTTLARLLEHRRELSAPVVRSIRDALDDVTARLERPELRVVVVGEPGSGKSTFLDALLGERLLAPSETTATITLRRAEERDYRALFGDGTVEQFSKRVSDSSAEVSQELARAEAAGEQQSRDRAAAFHELTDARATLERTESALAASFREFETARQEADRLGGEQHERERRHAELAIEIERADQALPDALRRRPEWWHVLRWILWLCLFPFAWRRHAEQRRLFRQREQNESRLLESRSLTARAAERCAELELLLSRANGPSQRARARLSAAEQRAAETEASMTELGLSCDRLRAELTRRRRERERRFAAELSRVVGSELGGRRLLEIEIDYPARVLPEDIAMIDCPGAFASDQALESRFWNTLHDRADACILVSELDKAVSGKTRTVLQELRGSVVHAILVLTKLDQAVRAALRHGSGELSESVERARRIATRRFAREVGRDPDTVLSVAVGAEDALEHPDEAYAGFEREASKLFLLLRQERALILGARCATVVRRCIALAADTERVAEQAYLDRIGALEAGRRPEPAELKAELLLAAEPELQRAAGKVVDVGEQTALDSTRVLRRECETLVLASASRAELRALAPPLGAAIDAGLLRVQAEIAERIAGHAERELQTVEAIAYRLVRQRYDLLHEITRVPGTSLKLELGFELPRAPQDLQNRIDHAIRACDRLRFGLAAGGAATGLTLGSLLLLGVGSAGGLLVGALAGFVVTPGLVKRRCAAVVDVVLTELHVALDARIALSAPVIAAGMAGFLDQLIEHALLRFGRWIAEPLEAERAAIQAERENLKDLQEVIVRLRRHDDELATLGKAAADSSLGLCRVLPAD